MIPLCRGRWTSVHIAGGPGRWEPGRYIFYCQLFFLIFPMCLLPFDAHFYPDLSYCPWTILPTFFTCKYSTINVKTTLSESKLLHLTQHVQYPYLFFNLFLSSIMVTSSFADATLNNQLMLFQKIDAISQLYKVEFEIHRCC